VGFTEEALDEAFEAIAALPESDFNEANVAEALKGIGMPSKDLMKPLRHALTGKSVSCPPSPCLAF
jgi:hypothetical protein